jgi:two-component sensor histidine kinase
MIAPPIPVDELERLDELIATNLLDSPKDFNYDQLAILASTIFNVPYAIITLIDKERQWFKSCVGIPNSVTQTPRESSFCAHAINTPNEVLIINDTAKDDRFKDNPMVVGPLSLKFYAGAPIISHTGKAYGTICIADNKERTLTPLQIESLKILANQVTKLIDLRLKNNELKQQLAEKTVLLKEIHHRVKNNLQMVSSLLNLQARFIDDKTFYNAIEISQNRIRSMALLHEFLYQSKTLSIIVMEDYLTSLLAIKCKSFEESVSFKTNIKYINLVIEHALPIGLIVNEFIANTLKHGIDKDKICNITINFEQKEENEYTLTYLDNGPGLLHDDNIQTGIGMDLVDSFVDQINGKLTTLSSNKGLQHTIKFKL